MHYPRERLVHPDLYSARSGYDGELFFLAVAPCLSSANIPVGQVVFSETDLAMQPVASGSTTPTVEHVHSPLDDELERDEALFERYGGDDPEDPPLPTSSQSSTQHDDTAQPITHEPGKRHESHLVSWDGPQDPQNPQHWSRRYKWFVTVLMSILSVNV